GLPVGVEDEVAAILLPWGSKGADQHEQGGFGKMEVREKTIHHSRLIRRINKKSRAAACRLQRAIDRLSGTFEDAKRGGAHRENPFTSCVGGVYGRRGFGGEIVDFLVHAVLLHLGCLDRSESSQADMQSHFRRLNSFTTNDFQD